MRRQRYLMSGVICGTLITLVVTGGCRREEPGDPTPVMQSEAAQPTNQPITTSGCLLAGETADTFMLMTAQAEGSGQTKNYQLVSGPNTNLREHVGTRVQVSGTVEMQQAAQTQTFATPATDDDKKRDEQPAGTAGAKPMVQTQTTVTVDRLSVQSISPLDGQCQM